MSTEIQHSRNFNESKLYMWRTIIAIAHADGNVCEDERIYLEGVIDRMKNSAGLNNEEYSTLRQDLNQAQDPMEMLTHVEEPRYRGQILYFAHLLAGKDGSVCDSEQAVLDKLENEISKAINIDPIGEQAREDLRAALDESEHASQTGGLGSVIDRFLMSIGL